jgi:hypothetical protein
MVLPAESTETRSYPCYDTVPDMIAGYRLREWRRAPEAAGPASHAGRGATGGPQWECPQARSQRDRAGRLRQRSRRESFWTWGRLSLLHL